MWSAFGRHVVTKLTTVSTAVRGFTTLLLGRYFAADLVDRGMANREDALDIFLRMEQICAYAQYVGAGVDDNIRGIERVKRFGRWHGGAADLYVFDTEGATQGETSRMLRAGEGYLVVA